MQKIVVKRFMALTGEISIDLKNLLIIIGEQASGKSTLAKLIYFFRSLRQDFLYVVYENIDSPDNLQSAFRKEIRDKFYNFFGSTRHLDNFEVTFYYSSSKYIRLSLHEDKALKIFFGGDPLNKSLFAEINQYIRTMKSVSARKDAYEILAFQEAVSKTEQFIANIFEDNSQSLFIPAGRTITVSYPDQFRLDFYGNLLKGNMQQADTGIAHPPSVDLYLMTKFLEHTERIKNRFSDYGFQDMIQEAVARNEKVDITALNLALEKVRKILRGEYKTDQYGEKLWLTNTNFVFLNKASSGQQESIRILQDMFLILLDGQKSFRVIEEPEAHLYPLAQKHLIEMIALTLNSTNSETVITTHSPYVLSILNNLLFAANVAHKSNEIYSAVSTILPSLFWLAPTKCGVYSIKNGKCQSIFDEKLGLIQQNYLDEISEELGEEFDRLYEIYGKAT